MARPASNTPRRDLPDDREESGTAVAPEKTAGRTPPHQQAAAPDAPPRPNTDGGFDPAIAALGNEEALVAAPDALGAGSARRDEAGKAPIATKRQERDIASTITLVVMALLAAALSAALVLYLF